MVAIIEDKLQDLEQLCREYAVVRLEVFGSAVDGTFDPATSDLDFLVEFARDPTTNAFRQYFNFLIALKELYGRSVDLVEISAMKNPYFIASVNRSRKLLYAA